MADVAPYNITFIAKPWLCWLIGTSFLGGSVCTLIASLAIIIFFGTALFILGRVGN
jgi:hypothetical protein